MSATRSYALSAAFTATSPISRRVALFCGRGATAAGTVVAAGKQQESQSSKRCCRLPRAAAACSAKTPGQKTAAHIHRAERVLQRVSNRKAASPQVDHPRGIVAQRQAGQQAGDGHIAQACKGARGRGGRMEGGSYTDRTCKYMEWQPPALFLRSSSIR